MYRPHRLLHHEALACCRRVAESQSPAMDSVIEALGILVDHRHRLRASADSGPGAERVVFDDLIRVGGFKIPDTLPVRLCSFRARDPERTPLFVVATDQGELLLGRIDEFPEAEVRAGEGIPVGWQRRRLDDFDPRQDQIVSMVVSRWMRPLGRRLDLWVVVGRGRGAEKPDTRCYHGLVGLESGSLLLRPALDDSPGSVIASRIRAEPMSRDFSGWLKEDHFVPALGQDPFAAGESVHFDESDAPDADGDGLDTTERRAAGAVRRAIFDLAGHDSGQSIEMDRWDPGSTESPADGSVNTPRVRITTTAWSQRRVARGDAVGQLEIIDARTGDGRLPARVFDLGAPIRGLALAERADRAELAAGTIDCAVMGYTCVDGLWEPTWTQPVLDQPMALAWAPGDGENGLPGELLLAFRNGLIERAARVDDQPLSTTWHQLVGHVVGQRGPMRLLDLVEAWFGPAEDPGAARDQEAPRRALLLAFIERVCLEPEPYLTDAATRKRIVGLFRAVPTIKVPLTATRHLLDAVSHPGAEPDMVALLATIYDASPAAVREELDVDLRALRDRQQGPTHLEQWRQLLKRCARSRQDLLRREDIPPELEAALAIEAWANPYVLVETVRISGYGEPSGHHDRVPPTALVAVSPPPSSSDKTPGADAPHWVAVGRRTQVGVHRFHLGDGQDTAAHMQSTPAWRWPTDGPREQDILIDMRSAAVFGGRRCLVLAWRSGWIEILEPGGVGDGAGWVELARWHVGGRPVMLDVLDGHLFVAQRDRRRTVVVTRRLTRGAKPRSFELDLPRIAVLRVARRHIGERHAGFWLFASSTAGHPPQLVALDREACPEPPPSDDPVRGRSLRRLRSPVITAAFDDPRAPTVLALSTRDGMLYGEDIAAFGREGTLPPAPRWMYRTIGTPQSLAGVRRPGEASAFLLGTNYGRMTLLAAGDGRRRWGRRLSAGLHHLAVDPSAPGVRFALLAMDDGTVTSLESGRPFTLDALWARIEHADTTSLTHQLLDDADRESVRLLKRIFIDGSGQPSAVVDGFAAARHRETRARIIRWLVESDPSGTHSRTRQRLISKMNHRELQLLRMMLPPDEHGWDELVRLRLLGDYSKVPSGDDGVDAQMAAMATLMAHGASPESAAQRRTWRERFFEALPPPEYCANRWVAQEIARRILDAAFRATPDPKGRIALILDALMRVPLRVLTDLLALLPADSDVHRLLTRVEAIFTSMRGAPSRRGLEAIHALAEDLAPLRAREGGEVARLVGWLAEFHSRLSRAGLTDWEEERTPIIDALRVIGQEARATAERPEPLHKLVLGLDQMLPGQPPPPGDARLAERRRWLDTLRRSLPTLTVVRPVSEATDWSVFTAGLLRWTRARIGRLADCEERALRDLVRPHLTLRRGVVNRLGRAELEIAVEGEGNQQLIHAELTIAADGAGGLSGRAEALRITETYAAYPAPRKRSTHRFSATLPLERREVSIMTTLTGKLKDAPERSYTHHQTWRFELSDDRARIESVSLPRHLPRTFADLVGRLTAPGAPAVQLLVTDPAVSGPGERAGRAASDDAEQSAPRDAFARALVREHDAFWLDLDHPEAKGGERRDRFDVLTLTRPGRLNVIEGHRWLTHLLAAERLDVVREWFDALAGVSQSLDETRRVVWIVADAHLRELAVLGLRPPPGLAVIEAHRLDPRSAHASALSALARSEQTLWRSKIIEGRPQPLDALGSDLRFFLDWRRWAEAGDGTDRSEPSHDFEPIRRRAIADLGSLPPLARLVVQALAQSRLTIEPPYKGLEPAQRLAGSIEWIPQRGAFERREREQTLSKADIAHFKRAKTRSPVRIYGFGSVGTLDGTLSRLPALLERWRVDTPSELDSAIQILIGGGFADRAGEVTRMRSPYLEIIRDLYRAHPDLPADVHDQRVYSALHGPESSLLECLPLNWIRPLPTELQVALMPNLSDPHRQAVLDLAGVAQSAVVSPTRLAAIFTSIFDLPARPLDPPPDAPDAPLRRLHDLHVFGLDQAQPDGAHRFYVGWLMAGSILTAGSIGRAVERVAGRIGRRSGQRRHPLLMILGPGAEGMTDDGERRFGVLRLADLRRACLQGDLGRSLMRRARARMRHTFFSPFKVAGALPPGSPLFVGRRAEFEFIRRTLHQQSSLIIGSRRIGKTTLLNRVRHWLETEAPVREGRRLVPIAIDCAVLGSGAAFAQFLDFETREQPGQVTYDAQDPKATVLSLLAYHRARDELPVLLLNEVDRLYQGDTDFIRFLRGLDASGRARFVLVAYASALDLRRVKEPLFNMTAGLHYNGRATCLTALSEEAARDLLALLEAEPLSLEWRTPAEKRHGIQRLLNRSYRVPWALQILAERLVRRLEAQGRDVLTEDDVEHVLDGAGPLVWNELQQIDYKHLGFPQATDAHGPGMKLVLYALARERYFLGEAPVRRRNLDGVEPLSLGFTVGEARTIVTRVIDKVLTKEERIRVRRWFERLDLDEALRLLTLTLALEPDPNQGDRYAFLLHALPIELERQFGQEDPLLDSLLIDTALAFLENLSEDVND